ncbi:MAG: tRNA threonylcarbamoyladenosine dehydratase [Lachnospiraceae bacterium]|jgi:tRNA A37 threonylcarbamoyladenosine dehydratase|nr:tRNA threonylcarbamoyladenosine dehydratase [Lachnospiraceae bacterium]
MNQFSRTELLIGAQGIERLQNARVAVFGVGGVGGYTVEALARSGVGTLDLIDDDKVCLTNLNRQIIATHSTIGQYKVEVARERILDINPKINVHIYKTFYMPETADLFDFSQYDYVVDAIDTVTGKIQLVMQADKTHTPIISSMGAGNKMDPAAFKVADLYNTKVCPLAKVMRRELKKRGIQKLKVVYSEEIPTMLSSDLALSEKMDGDVDTKKRIPGSIAFVPAVAGLILAGEVIKDILRTGRDSDYDI